MVAPSHQRTLFSADPARVLTIAGSDSGGGAGIQADLKTIQALGGYGLSVLTALTAQNTLGVQAISNIEPEFVIQQFQSVASDIAIDAIKVGMLANTEIAKVVAELIRTRPTTSSVLSDFNPSQAPVVLDPVMVSTSGSLLLKPEAIEALLTEIVPQAAVLTPNLPEASAILHYYGQAVPEGLPQLSLPGFTTAPVEGNVKTGAQFQSLALQQAAQTIASHSRARAVLIKGGHTSFAQSEVESVLDHLGVKPVSRPVRVFVAPNTLPPGPGCALLADTEAVDAAVYQRLSENGEAEVSVVRTDLRPWSTILAAQRAQPAQGLNVAPDVDGGNVVADVLCETVPGATQTKQYRFTIVVKPHIPTAATHGTGCTLSSAIATHLASGKPLRQAVLLGIEYVQGAILHGLDQVGRGKHPLNHAHALVARAVPRRRSNHLPITSATNEADVKKAAELVHLGYLQPLTSQLVGTGIDEWTRYVNHPFVQQIGTGTLPLAAFKHFLTQDYLFLRHYANIWALAASKADTFEAISSLSSRTTIIAQEAELHITFCAQWGISRAQLEYDTTESRATLAYTRFVLDVSRRYAAAEMLVATLPCLLGYTEAGRNLALRHKNSRADGNPYADWIETYAHSRFQQGAVEGVDVLESLVENEVIAPSRLRTLKDIFHSAVKLEQGMWDEAIQVGLGEAVL